ncbi:M16 family metallopeptidase [Polycladidibacter stylochi]|uniref:M16 family metallopeptidase n=1 Tax=Polycladidibacter stylochi TaxID=1807766 RepID=UPI00082FEEC5|nr:pitrilysin family protein [Pseudovibrio stylochi]
MTTRVTRLDNGMTIVTDNMPHLKTAALGVWVGAGSQSEKASENGLTHLLEHMAFKGTKKRSALQIAEEVEAVGGEMNASTSVEHTNYYLRLMAEDVPLGLDILADILQESIFDPDELEREKHVILQEIGAAEDTPEDVAFDLLLETAWPDQSIGRPILGTPQRVKGFEPKDIRNYMDRRYSAQGMVLSASGAVSHDEIVSKAQQLFTKLSQTKPTAVPEITYHGGSKFLEKDLQEVQVILGFEGISYADQDYYAVQILASILGGGMSSRLFQKVREQRGLCYSIYAFHWAFTGGGLFAIHAATGPQDTEELMPVIVDELVNVTRTITNAEVQRAKAQIKASLLIALESPAARAGQIARQLMIYDRVVCVDELTQRVDAVSLEQVQKVAQRVFLSKKPTMVSVGPKSPMLSLSQVESRIKEARILS